MRAKQHVVVVLEGAEVPGLLLKWGRAGERALVTYEVGGKVATTWVLAAQLRAVPDALEDSAQPSC